MHMTWYDLAFLHWPVEPSLLRPHLPSGLELETFDGKAWLGVVPFAMSQVRPRFVPSVPWLSKFLELNVRTYVAAEGKPGVWFFSLDAANPLAVRGARWTFHLPYFDARMRLDHEADGWLRYRSERTHRRAAPATFAARYRPAGDVYAAAIGTFDHWLIERYCLYAADRRGRIFRGEILHSPWPIQRAEVELAENGMAEQLGFSLPAVAPVAHFCRWIETVAWSLRPIDA